MAPNDLSGSFPEFAQEAPLAQLRLLFTKFAGTLPTAQHSNDYELRRASMCSCEYKRTSGQLGVIAQVDVLGFNIREISGVIPVGFFSFRNLTQLELSGNGLSETIPSISQLSDIQVFGPSENSFSGSVPDLAGLTSIESIDWGANQSHQDNARKVFAILFGSAPSPTF